MICACEFSLPKFAVLASKKLMQVALQIFWFVSPRRFVEATCFHVTKRIVEIEFVSDVRVRKM